MNFLEADSRASLGAKASPSLCGRAVVDFPFDAKSFPEELKFLWKPLGGKEPSLEFTSNSVSSCYLPKSGVSNCSRHFVRVPVSFRFVESILFHKVY